MTKTNYLSINQYNIGGSLYLYKYYKYKYKYLMFNSNFKITKDEYNNS